MSPAHEQPGDERYDAIIVGSGAGGCAAAYELARAGLRVALLERGNDLPRDASTLDVQQVVHEGRFKQQEKWQDNRGQTLCPEEWANVGGKTKWYGAALLRYGRDEFGADIAHQCRGWPITYDDLAPYYERAEKLLGVRNFPCEPDLQSILDRLARRAPDWRAESLPMGLSANILEHAREARHFDGFASAGNFKGDAETAFLNPVRELPNLQVLTGTTVTELLADTDDATRIVGVRIGGVRIGNGTPLRARTVLLAAGALHSPRLLQHYLQSNALAARLPCHSSVGRYLKLHLLTAMVAISFTHKTDLLRKTMLLLNTALPHSSVQPLGFDGELISTLIPRFVPRFIARQVGERAYGFFLQTEDGAHPDNRVIAPATSDQQLPILDYDDQRTISARHEHQQLVRSFRFALARIGMLGLSQRIGLAGTAHVSGTLVAGDDPTNSVVSALGKVHGLQSLYVVDGSVLPRSSRVNPSLTIYAWSLRVAEQLAAQLRASTTSTRDAMSA